ncbi:MAG: hypothetical protein ACOYL3_07200 [Desulfuromonadaceae bacterium]
MTDYKNKCNWRGYRMAEHKRQSAQAIMLCVLLLVAFGIAGAYEQEPAVVDDAHELFIAIPRDVAVVRAVAKSGTQERVETLLPVPVAKAIAERSVYPKTMAAIAHTESGGDHTAVGDRGLARGLFQVWGSLHGAVPDTIEGQVDQANRLFLAMVKEYGYRSAVARWNGTPSLPKVRSYQRVVLAKVQELGR